MELTEEQKKFKEESLELLKQSNDADYKAFLKKVDEIAKRNLPLDTKIEYVTGRCCGFEGIGIILSGVIRWKDQVILARFDRPMRTKREGGECHACVDIFSLGRIPRRRPAQDVRREIKGGCTRFRCHKPLNMRKQNDENLQGK